MADKKKSVKLLPEYLRTDKNSKFLSSTVDQFIQTPDLERIDGYVGSKITPNYDPTTDFYLKDKLSLRNSYALEPALVFKDKNANINDVISYDDIINEIQVQKGNVSNLDKILRSEFYAYDPLIDWDKLVNYNQYYWLSEGPEPILLNSNNLDVDGDIVGQSSYLMDNGYQLSNGMKIVFTENTVQEKYHGKTYLVEGVGSSIKLIDYDLLGGYELMNTVLNETFDSNEFDSFPFDSDRRLPLNPEYLTINRASNDLNPWSRYNRWFHSEVIETTAKINGKNPIFSLDKRAKRPIVEFRANLQLFQFGKNGIKNIDYIDTDTTNAFETVDGSYGYYVDGHLLEKGDRVIFNADLDDNVRGKIYKVSYTNDPSPILHLVDAVSPEDMDSVAVNFGDKNEATSWYFDSLTTKWIYAQQHNKLNQPPLFDLFNSDGVSYSNLDNETNNFRGNKIFGYDIGTGTSDPVLGFPLKYQNSVGVGSYLFKNYFMTETITVVSNNLSKVIPTSVTLLKLNDEVGGYDLVNIWKTAEGYQIPVLEIQNPTSDTSTIYVTCFDKPIDTNVAVTLFVNNAKIPSTTTATSSKITVVTTATIAANETVLLKILTDQAPNENGFYETPIGLTNNPLNGPITDMTLSELTDHVSTMVNRLPGYTGTNLRDFSDYSKYGTRLITNSNPISFAKIFLGKKEHNVIDALRASANHYNQFKLNLLRYLISVDEQSTPADALDSILKDINTTKDIRAPYYRSDMLGFGQDKTIRSFTITDTDIVEYPIGFEFDLTSLSFKSVIVYLNDEQLLHGTDYTFNFIDGSITLLCDLALNDIITIHAYSNTLGCYIPPTPTKLGLFPKFVPEIYTDSTYITPTTVIRGHDGSIMVAYGDYRDDIILEYEKRVYNNIKVAYNNEIFDINSVIPGAFRETNFELGSVNDILAEDFTRWAGLNGVDTSTNNSFDEGNSFTWNYKNSVDRVLGKSITGYWRNVYKYFFDTDRPHTHPWEMLGYSEKPSWWDTYYSWTPGSKRTALIQAVVAGRTMEPPSTEVNQIYARPQFASMVPVDNSGNLKSPSSFLTTDTSYLDKKANWKFGDQSPAETAWRRSSYWPFVANILSALADPCSYCSKLFDVSRTTLNSLNQVSYTADDLYLDPRKLIIDGEDQTAGFGVYVVENGKFKDISYISTLRQDLDYLDFNLFHKLGGFASKEKLQITIDSIDPVSTSPGVVLPPEDYQLVLNVSNPVKSSSISGIIIQKVNGKFVMKGYDVSKPYFEILKPIKTAAGGAVTVGGVSENFTEWSGTVNNGNNGLSAVELVSATANTTRYYKQGQIVRYGAKFYRTLTGHNAKQDFDPTLFQELSGLPIKGGASAQLPSGFEKVSTRIPYGSEFTKIQEVYDVIVGYGAWLEKEGFVFDEFNKDLGQIVDWKFTAKEFLYWTTQNWANNNLITLSPFADSLKYQFSDTVVDDVLSTKYEYSLLKADGKPFPAERFTLTREDGYCVIKTLNTEDGLFFATLNSIQKEHAIVFNNSTIFNDTIYDSESGYKQRRVKLSGFRTKNWNGDLFSPGFVYDDVSVNDWKSYQDYLPGNVVRYNGSYYQSLVKILGDELFDFKKWAKLPKKPESGLIPNFDYKINQFEDFYSLDIDNFDYKQQQLAQHLIGYTPRTYLNNIFTNPISQYKFYQGFIKDKGTKNAIDKLSKASQSISKGTLEFSEEWAFRVGNYGGFETYNELEFNLAEGTSLENPYIVKFVDIVPSSVDPLINYVTPNDCLLAPNDYVSSSTFITVPGTWDDTNLKLTHAGYVRIDDVTATAYNKDSLIDIANNSSIQHGNTFWLGFLEDGNWAVYRYARRPAKISGVFVSSPGVDITFVTDSHHGLAVGDVVSIVNFNDQVNGVYIVTGVPKLSQFTVASTLTTIENEELLAYGILFRFDKVRFTDFLELSNATDLIHFSEGEKFWIDNGTNDKWQVYEKIKNFSTKYLESNDYVLGQQLGYRVYASDDTPVVMVASPSWTTSTTISGYGRVKAYTKVNKSYRRDFEHGINSNDIVYCSTSSITEFGYSLAYDVSKGLYFAGAPAASNIKASLTSGTVVLSTGSESAKSFAYEGLIKISSNNDRFDEEITQAVLVSPYAHTATTAVHARFGHSIFINQVDTSTSTLLLIGAPGDSVSSVTGSVYAYLVNQTATTTISAHPSGIVLSKPSIFSTGDLWGYRIAGNKAGSRVAISAPNHAGTGTTGVVLIYTGTNNSLTYSDIIFPEYDNSGNFGHDVTVSQSGNYMFVTDPEYTSPGEPYGKVSIYKLNSESKYELWQILSNPVKYNDLKFGSSISINKNEDTLVISSLGTNRSRLVNFDTNTQEGETTFDKNTTQFTDAILDSGEVYVYNKLGEYFVPADEISNEKVVEGSQFGMCVVSTNNTIYVGAPSQADTAYPDNSKVFIFDKVDTATNTWSMINEQPDLVDSSKFKRIALIDTLNEEISEYLDIIDPLKGKIAGIAAQEIKYRSAADPAIYSVGRVGTVNDPDVSWLDEHVGELWWDLSTAKYMWYEQGSDTFRKNNWGRLFPGATIDVYEWVKTDLLPTEWAAQADTNEGLTNGVSGQPKYPDNTVISIKQVYNNVTNTFENVYFYWVKNKVILPSNVKDRRLSSYQVSSIIADPVANGLKFVEILSNNSMAFANVQPMLSGSRINASIAVDTIDNLTPRHTEWLLLSEGVENSVPNTLLEKKLIDSLLGHDINGNPVPAKNLTARNRYGLGIRPQQTLFKDRLAALRNIITFTNSVLIKNQITGNYSFDTLNKEEPIPDIVSREYDYIVEDVDAISDIDTVNFRQAKLICHVTNGKISSVEIIDSGSGYINPPEVKIVSDVATDAKLLTTIDDQGSIVSIEIFDAGEGFVSAPILEVRQHTVIVQVNADYGNRWTKHAYDYVTGQWIRTKTQGYNVPLYWEQVDWVSPNFNEFKIVKYTIDNLYEINSLTSIKDSEYVKVKNNGSGKYIILEKTDQGDFIPSYNIVYSEQGTIQLLDTLWNYDLGKYAFDSATLEETLYDQVPDLELYYILQALKNDIFVGTLKVNWNLLFFAAVKYALTEQKLLDWAFKTSFINVKNVLGSLDQRPVYKLDNEGYFEDYIKEVKPYHTQIRNYTSNYTSVDEYRGTNTDFDLPSYFNSLTEKFTTVSLGDDLLNEYPWKWWADYYKYYVEEIRIADGGAGYTQHPTVTLTTAPGDTGSGATAQAYIRNGKVYKIIVTNAGSNYKKAPLISITGGGSYVTRTATASVIINNYGVRKNLVGMRFDRISKTAEIEDVTVTDTFVCSGDKNSFTLSWLADHDKLKIIPKLDGKLILGADYRIEYYTDEYAGYTKKFSRFVFLNEVPKENQIFKITYQKSIDLFNAIDRIDKYYQPTETMYGKDYPLLMTGLEYPQTSLQGLKFSDTPPWGTTAYDTAPWGNLVNNFTKVKLTSALSISDSVIHVNTTTGITTGQSILVLTTATSPIFRKDTVVSSVDAASRTVTITSPSYELDRAQSTSTASGSTITFITKENFNGNIRMGDIVTVSGITTGGFSTQYTVNTCTNNTFEVTATSVLANITATITPLSNVRVFSILSPVSSTATMLDRVVESSTGTSTMVIETYALYSDVVTATVSMSTGGYTISISTSTDIPPRAIVTLNNVTSTQMTTATVTLYGYTNLEFWTNNTDYYSLDTALSGGTWDTNLSGALGVAPEDIIIDGDTFINSNSSYAPEEYVPGHTLDSLGINVYTQPEVNYPTVLSGAIPVTAGVAVDWPVFIAPDNAMSVMVYFNGRLLTRVPADYFNSDNQFYLSANRIKMPAQPVSGKAYYTMVFAGADSQMDSNYALFTNATTATATATVASSLSLKDVKSVYVTVNGQEIGPYTGTAPGYILKPYTTNNKRAAVDVIVPPGNFNINSFSFNIEAWFFKSPQVNYNKFREENYSINSSTQLTSQVVSYPSTGVEPFSSQVIVTVGDSNQRIRLRPPSVSYYKVLPQQVTFDIDNKHERSGVYNSDNVKVYVNGYVLRPGFDYSVNTNNETVTIINNLVSAGDVVAIESLIDYDYVLIGNTMYFTNPLTNTSLQIISFEDNQSMNIRTERFETNNANEYRLSLPVLNQNYVWVNAGSRYLIGGYEFQILEDMRTIQISDWVELDPDEEIIITTITPPGIGSQIIAYRVFKDIFDRQHYKRISKYYTTKLARPLTFTDTEIYVTNGDGLAHPNPEMNLPGVVLIDGERIEYLTKNGNVLSQLRRSTLGTGPALSSSIGTDVIDQSIKQTIHTGEYKYEQHITTSSSTVVISTSTMSFVAGVHQGQGIVLLTDTINDQPPPRAVDQLEVYYGGRRLRKTTLVVHDSNISYDNSPASLTTLEPEFYITTSTQELTLNINEEITTGTRITVVQKKGAIWTTASLLTSGVEQAVFLRARPAELPDSYYYGGSLELTDDNNVPLLDDDGNPLEGL